MGLVTPNDTHVDVGHEALLRHWERVSGVRGASGDASDPRRIGWLKEEARDGRWYQALLSLVEGEGASGHTTLPLDQVAEGYRAMDERRAIKTLLRP